MLETTLIHSNYSKLTNKLLSYLFKNHLESDLEFTVRDLDVKTDVITSLYIVDEEFTSKREDECFYKLFYELFHNSSDSDSDCYINELLKLSLKENYWKRVIEIANDFDYELLELAIQSDNTTLIKTLSKL